MKQALENYKAKLEHDIVQYMAMPTSDRNINAIRGMIECWEHIDAMDKACGLKHELSEEAAEKWATGMMNEDGTVGAHWSKQETTAVAEAIGVRFEHITEYCWWVTMNMMYSDYCYAARKNSVDTPYFYADLAKAFLFDKDGGTPQEKLAGYYNCIVNK